MALGIVKAYVFVPKLVLEGETVAYRGGGGPIDYNKLNKKGGCTANSLLDSDVKTVENTVEAVSESVSAGADIIHLNVHRTSDNQLVVFHDWKLDCATNITGAINKLSFKEIENVDAGFGYTYDDGVTFPFRGIGFKVSKLETFYSLYPKYKFWLNLKNNDKRSFNVLYTYLSNLPPFMTGRTMVMTSSKGIDWFRGKDLNIRTASVGSVKSCGVDYFLVGWAGVVPKSCRNTTLLIPPSLTKYFWGYPKRLAANLQEYGSDVYLWSKHHPIDQKLSAIVKDGVGVVTSDLHFINRVKNTKLVNKNAS